MVIEDGSGVEGATNYQTVAQVVARIAAEGIWSAVDAGEGVSAFSALDPPVQDAVLSASGRRLEAALRTTATGWAYRREQGLAFPRVGHFLDGNPARYTVGPSIPREVLTLDAMFAELEAAALATESSGEQAPEGIRRIRHASGGEIEYFPDAPATTRGESRLAAEASGLLSRVVVGVQPTGAIG